MARRLVFYSPPEVAPAEMADSASWLAGLGLEWCWMSKLVFGNFRRCSPVVGQIGWGQQNQG